ASTTKWTLHFGHSTVLPTHDVSRSASTAWHRGHDCRKPEGVDIPAPSSESRSAKPGGTSALVRRPLAGGHDAQLPAPIAGAGTRLEDFPHVFVARVLVGAQHHDDFRLPALALEAVGTLQGVALALQMSLELRRRIQALRPRAGQPAVLV